MSTAELAIPQSSNPIIWTPSFATKVDQAIEMKHQKNRFFQSVMDEGVHYGVVPGTGSKPTLFKAGAEMLLSNMGLNPSYEDEGVPIIDVMGTNYGGEPFVYYRRECRIYRQTGPKEDDRMVVGKASGVCSSWESKYRYRNASLTCPSCGKDTIKASKFDDGKPFYCHKKMGGCGDQFEKHVFEGAVLGRIPNPDVADLINTVLKMADKRALVAATLISTGCSDIFTQDVEDMVIEENSEPYYGGQKNENSQQGAPKNNPPSTPKRDRGPQETQNKKYEQSEYERLVVESFGVFGIDSQTNDADAVKFVLETIAGALNFPKVPARINGFGPQHLSRFLELNRASLEPKNVTSTEEDVPDNEVAG